MATCECNLAGNFTKLANLGIISASLRTNKNIIITEGGLLLFGPTLGDLSITAYAPLNGDTILCPGRAGVSYEWDQRLDCDTYSYMRPVFIPRGKDKAYIEGDVPNTQITMTSYGESYTTFEASAASGPYTIYFENTHNDGYNFVYSGVPIPVDSDNGKNPTIVSFLSTILPAGSSLYLTNFGWEGTPPNIPTVSYSFIFSYNE